MAHKLKTRRVPHVRKDGKPGTKNDYRVVCKRRGKVCCDETFTTKREADDYITKHWDFVNTRKGYIDNLVREKHRITAALGGRGVKVRIRVVPDTMNFQSVGFTGGRVETVQAELADVA